MGQSIDTFDIDFQIFPKPLEETYIVHLCYSIHIANNGFCSSTFSNSERYKLIITLLFRYSPRMVIQSFGARTRPFLLTPLGSAQYTTSRLIMLVEASHNSAGLPCCRVKHTVLWVKCLMLALWLLTTSTSSWERTLLYPVMRIIITVMEWTAQQLHVNRKDSGQQLHRNVKVSFKKNIAKLREMHSNE